tara:strand:- start:534 stop:650 length:117 start_codon:yes stop_codon:yes gene_type:complete
MSVKKEYKKYTDAKNVVIGAFIVNPTGIKINKPPWRNR